MNDSLRQQFERLALRLNELDANLSDPQVAANLNRYRALLREQSEVADVVGRYRRYLQREADLNSAREMLADPEMAEMAREEITAAQADLERLQLELQTALIPRDPDDDRNAFVEIRAGTGGDESALFAGDLARMYLRWFERQGWRVEVMSQSDAELGGYKELVLRVEGGGVFGQLRFESGGHRVQRVPATEAQGRIHTSTATVAVLPEAEEVDVKIDPEDLEITVQRASGPGGQGVNTTDSAVRIVHKPSGLTVYCADDRSQIKNKARAMAVLRSRLLKLKEDEEHAKYAAQRRDQIGTGGRSERIRTYSFPQNRVTDHRIGLTLYSLPAVLEGSIDQLIQALQRAEFEEKLAALTGGPLPVRSRSGADED